MINPIQIKLNDLNANNISHRMRIINGGDNYKLIGLSHKISEAENINWLDGYEKDSSKKLFVITYGEKPCGLIGLTKINQSAGSANLFIVNDGRYKNKGIGSRAMDLVITYAKNKYGITSIFLTVKDKNTVAIDFYKKLGFKEIKNNPLENELEFVLNI